MENLPELIPEETHQVIKYQVSFQGLYLQTMANILPGKYQMLLNNLTWNQIIITG